MYLRHSYWKTLVFLIVTLWISSWILCIWALIAQGLFDRMAYGNFWQRTGGSLGGFIYEVFASGILYNPFFMFSVAGQGLLNSSFWIQSMGSMIVFISIVLTYSGLTKKNLWRYMAGVVFWLIAIWGFYCLGIVKM